MNRVSHNRRKGRSSTNWLQKSTRFAIYHRDGFDCQYCHGVFPLAYDGVGLTVDHIVPRCKGGTHRPENLITACSECNSRRQDKELKPSQLRKFQAQAFKPLNRDVGKYLAWLLRLCRDSGQIHPMTGRVPPKGGSQSRQGWIEGISKSPLQAPPRPYPRCDQTIPG